jgi:glycosyltransferase involved in cell wall biosynthesis
MVSKGTIAYVGNFSFPYGNASGSRVLGNGYLFKELGYEVIFIGLDNTLKVDSFIQDTKSEYNGFAYYNLPYPIGMKGWLLYNQRFKEVISCLTEYDLFAVVSYGSPTLSLFNAKIRTWCHSNNLFYLADCVDWLAAGSGTFLHRIIKFFDNDYQKRILNAKADGVITISSYLQDFYQSNKCKTIIIPPLVNPERFKNLSLPLEKKGKTINFIYVGIPFPIDGREVKPSAYKDRLDIVIDALLLISEDDFKFDIYGLTKQQYISVILRHKDMLVDMDDKICFHGNIKNDEAIIRISKADYSILFRDVNRSTTSGFPSKFVETISCGTPMVTTRTSDLHLYLEPSENGFFIGGNDDITIAKELSEIIKKSSESVFKMKKYCFKSNLFAYHNFVTQTKQFFDSLK